MIRKCRYITSFHFFFVEDISLCFFIFARKQKNTIIPLTRRYACIRFKISGGFIEIISKWPNCFAIHSMSQWRCQRNQLDWKFQLYLPSSSGHSLAGCSGRCQSFVQIIFYACRLKAFCEQSHQGHEQTSFNEVSSLNILQGFTSDFVWLQINETVTGIFIQRISLFFF